jgi:hypothetical protein
MNLGYPLSLYPEEVIPLSYPFRSQNPVLRFQLFIFIPVFLTKNRVLGKWKGFLVTGNRTVLEAGLLNSLKDPLSGNLVLQVTPYTSLKLRGRTVELPRPDFNRQVIRFTRHTLLMFSRGLLWGINP